MFILPLPLTLKGVLSTSGGAHTWINNSSNIKGFYLFHIETLLPSFENLLFLDWMLLDLLFAPQMSVHMAIFFIRAFVLPLFTLQRPPLPNNALSAAFARDKARRC